MQFGVGNGYMDTYPQVRPFEIIMHNEVIRGNIFIYESSSHYATEFGHVFVLNRANGPRWFWMTNEEYRQFEYGSVKEKREILQKCRDWRSVPFKDVAFCAMLRNAFLKAA